MNEKVGILVNRLVIGFTFAFVYQIFVGIATSIFSLPLTGHIQDLISGIEDLNSESGLLFLSWWIISTVIITLIAILIVKNKKYLSPYKHEKNIDIPTRITAFTIIIIGVIISVLFFLLDLTIGSIVKIGSATDVMAIYQAASSGDFGPLAVSIIFSIVAGFIIVGVIGKTSKVKEITKDIGFTKLGKITKIIKKNPGGTKTSSDTVGLHPGALVHVGAKYVEKVSYHQIEYGEQSFLKSEHDNIDECLNTKEKDTITWTNITGLHDPEVIKKFGEYYNLHLLVQADIMNTELRPKIEFQDGYIFAILKQPHILSDGKLFLEQISLVVGENYILSFQETDHDVFDPIRERLEKNIGQLRKRKSDFLAYSLADAIVDSYFVIMEQLGNQSEDLEKELMDDPTPKTLQTIHILKRELVMLRKSIWPLREVIDNFERVESKLINDSSKKYFRDVYNHTIQVMDNIEGLRDMIGGMLDTYLSSVSNKMNEVMKTLTIIASIFIPITFIAGIYGTNFDYIPELSWEGSYFVMLTAMTIITIIMLSWFRKKRWL